MSKHTAAPEISCPTCEYRYGHAGQPVAHTKGLLTCECCHSKWRDLNHIQYINDQSITHLQPMVAKSTSVQTPDNFIPGPLQREDKIRRRTGFSILSAVVCGMLIFLLVGGGYQNLFSDHFAPLVSSQTSPLTLDNIKVEDRKNNRVSFWIITARITNKTVHAVTIPPILMRSGEKGSSGYFDWMHRPALQKLAPGSNLIIRTSIHKPIGSSKNIKMKFADHNLSSG